MIERTIFDLRIAEHSAITANINASDWQQQGKPKSRPIRAALAAALVALAARLAPERAATASPGRVGHEQPATA